MWFVLASISFVSSFKFFSSLFFFSCSSSLNILPGATQSDTHQSSVILLILILHLLLLLHYSLLHSYVSCLIWLPLGTILNLDGCGFVCCSLFFFDCFLFIILMCFVWFRNCLGFLLIWLFFWILTFAFIRWWDHQEYYRYFGVSSSPQYFWREKMLNR